MVTKRCSERKGGIRAKGGGAALNCALLCGSPVRWTITLVRGSLAPPSWPLDRHCRRCAPQNMTPDHRIWRTPSCGSHLILASESTGAGPVAGLIYSACDPSDVHTVPHNIRQYSDWLTLTRRTLIRMYDVTDRETATPSDELKRALLQL